MSNRPAHPLKHWPEIISGFIIAIQRYQNVTNIVTDIVIYLLFM